MKSKSNILTENLPFILSIDAIFAEYRMRLGIKLKQACFSALAFHYLCKLVLVKSIKI